MFQQLEDVAGSNPFDDLPFCLFLFPTDGHMFPLMKIAQNCSKPTKKVAQNYPKLLKIAQNCSKPTKKVAQNYPKLLKITQNCSKLLKTYPILLNSSLIFSKPEKLLKIA